MRSIKRKRLGLTKEIVLNSDGSFTLVEHQPGERTLVILITPQEMRGGVEFMKENTPTPLVGFWLPIFCPLCPDRFPDFNQFVVHWQTEHECRPGMRMRSSRCEGNSPQSRCGSYLHCKGKEEL